MSSEADELRARVEEWVRAKAYAPDDIVLGDGKDYDLICADVRDLLDLVHPDWRSVFTSPPDEGSGT
jgi:hypothetical protein